MLTVPIRGADMVEPSNLTVAFGGDRTISSAIEVQYRGDTASDQGRVTAWTDGQLTMDRMVDDAGNDWKPGTPTPEQSDTEQIQLAWSFSKFLDCLNAQGVSGWVVTGISLACAAACAATAGTGCLGCIAAAGSIGSGVIGACIYKAGK